MPLSWAVGDRPRVGRLGVRQECVKLVHGIIEEEIVGVADPDMEFPLELGSKLRPVFLEDSPEVVGFPV